MVFRSLWVFHIGREKDAGLAVALNATGGMLLGLLEALSEKALFVSNSTLDFRLQIHPDMCFQNFM